MIHFQVEMQDLTKIEAALGMTRDKSKIVLRSAINNAAKQIEKNMVKATWKGYLFRSYISENRRGIDECSYRKLPGYQLHR